MKWLAITLLLVCSPAFAGKFAISASRANCWAITPVGIGYHNESLSWDFQNSHKLWVSTNQKATNASVTRWAQSGLSYQITKRAYAGGADAVGSYYGNMFWDVTGHHREQFSLWDNYYLKTNARTCNLSQGWPWS